jgi:Helix-turn-helix
MIEIHPQTIRSPSGDELVVLTRTEYDALSHAAAEAIEEADDIAIFDARTAELVTARDARLPAEVTAAVIRGDSLLRALRRWKGMTQLDVALRSKLAQGYISDLENGRKPGTPRTLRAIAKALRIDPAWLGA